VKPARRSYLAALTLMLALAGCTSTATGRGTAISTRPTPAPTVAPTTPSKSESVQALPCPVSGIKSLTAKQLFIGQRSFTIKYIRVSSINPRYASFNVILPGDSDTGVAIVECEGTPMAWHTEYGTADGTDECDHISNALAVSLNAGCAVYPPGTSESAPAQTKYIGYGKIVIVSPGNIGSVDGQDVCEGTGPNAGLEAGASVTIADESGQTVYDAVLLAGAFGPNSATCTFLFAYTVPSDLPIYEVSVIAGTNPYTFTSAQMKSNTVTINIFS
jgi:hypothetical protein